MLTTASFISKYWHDQIVANDRQALFLLLCGFIASFAFIRLSTRLMRSPRVTWWPGSVVSEGGLHLHHLVFGICTMLASGTVAFALFDNHPYIEICAALFGIGAGLTIDEFALWVYLDDVYWAKEGRSSVDATVIALAGMGLVFLGVVPISFETGSLWQVITSIAAIVFLLVVVALCFAKQRLMHGAIGFFLSPLALYGAVRLGKPGSPWARRFYGDRNPRKQTQAENRFRPGRRTERFKERMRDAIGGETEEEFQAKLAERQEQTQTTPAEVRDRAERLG